MLYGVPNVVTAIAYIYIGLGLKKGDKREQSAVEKFLFQSFILLCGLHHLTHPFFMYFDIFWPMIGIDFAMTYISVLAAIKLRV